MEIELYRGASSFKAELIVNEDGEIGSDCPLDVLVQRNPIGTAAFILHTQAEADMWKQRIKQLTATVKAFESNAERAKASLKQVMQLTCVTSIKSSDGMFQAVLHPCRDVSVDVFDEAQLSADYMREVPARYEPDKKLIKKALDDGFEVAGARIVRKDRLTIS